VLYAGIELTGLFGDVVFLAIVVAFFGICVLFVKACEAIAGAGPAEVVAERSPTRDDEGVEEVAA
jgi:hypothetical protein